jgi:ribosomal protein S18 acetylase RimI-like enzyme
MDGILAIEPARKEYWEFIRELRTHPELKDGFIYQGEITPKEQSVYMTKHHAGYYIATHNGVPAGFVGVVDNDIRVAVLPSYQNKGIAKFLISHIIKKYPNSLARVKLDNESSLKLFKSLKFKIREIEEKNGCSLYLMSR